MGIKIVVLIILSLIYLIWNVLNEVSVSNYWNTNDKKYIKDWHKYDTIFRLVSFPIVVFLALGLINTSIKVILIVGILYRPLFNMGFNYWRNKQVFKDLTFKQRMNVLLYLSEYSVIDSFLIRLNNKIYPIIEKFSLWLAKVTKDRIIIRRNIKFQYLNLILIIFEVLLSIIIAIWL